jgi:hypothetical protein
MGDLLGGEFLIDHQAQDDPLLVGGVEPPSDHDPLPLRHAEGQAIHSRAWPWRAAVSAAESPRHRKMLPSA